MWIRLLKPIDGKPIGEFVDVEDKVGRAYVEAGLATEEKEGPEKHLLKVARDEYMQSLRDFARDTAKTLQEARTGLHASVIEPGESEAERRMGPADFVRNVYLAEASRDPEVAREANERLGKVYKSKRGMAEGAGATGGFVTPHTIEAEIQKVEAEEQVILPMARNVPLTTRSVEYPALDQYQTPTAGQSAFYGGVKVFRKGESSQRTASQPGYKNIILTANDVTAYTELSRDLVMDASTPQDAYVTGLIGEALGWRNDWESLNGSGVGQMLGIFNAACTILVTRNTGSTVKYVDLSGMLKRLLAASSGTAVWVAHPYMMDILLQIQDPSSRYIFQPTLNLQGESSLGIRPKWQIFGIPILFTEKSPLPGSTGDLLLADRKQYLYGTRSGTEIGLSEHFKFDTDQIAIRAKCRNDGQPRPKSAITLADGSSTVSAFVALN